MTRRPHLSSSLARGLVLCLGSLVCIACGGGSSAGNDNQNNGNGNDTACGNGVLEGAEECDDGEQNSDSTPDACRTTCHAAHCGDEVTDTGEECDDGPANANGVPDACRADCTTPVCGDGVVDVEGGETCDDGNTVTGDGCSDVCVVEYCGNGMVDPGERCDDGNTMGGDGCSADCASLETCGNGIVDVPKGELCDDGNNDNGDGCQANCTLPSCGDQVVDITVGEVCDDGNNVSGDGCNATCTSDETCGNGIVDPSEQCDCGAGPGSTVLGCQGVENSNAPDAVCRADCTLRRCGDGVVDAGSGEQCDTTAAITTTCADLGHHPGAVTCGGTCRFDTGGCGGYCGDGVRNGDETCDGTDLAGEDCTDHGYYGGALTCQTNCEPSFGQCAGRCGDGIKDPGELCDHLDFGGLSCADYGYYTGALTCSSTCDAISETPGCAQRCGDGILNGTEECDGEDVGLNTHCMNFVGYEAGRLSCDATCKRRFNTCFAPGWQSVPSPTGVALLGIWGSSDTDIYAVGSLGTILHNTGGSQWSSIVSGTSVTLRGIWGSAADDVYVVGDAGTLLHYDGAVWTGLNPGTQEDLAGVHGVSATDVYLVGGQGTILHGNRSAGWTPMDSGTTDAVAAVWANSPTELFAVTGWGSTCRSLESSGGTWTDLPLPDLNAGGTSVNTLWGADAQHVWAGGLDDHIWFYDGSSWVTQRNDAAFGGFWRTIKGLWGTDQDFVMAVGRYGAVRLYDGTSWAGMDAGTLNHLYAVWGTSRTNVFAVGADGIIKHYGGTGSGWQIVDEPAAGVEDVQMFSDTEAVAVSGSDVLQWDGTDWTVLHTIAGETVYSIWGVGATDLYVLTNLGRIYRYVSGGWSLMDTLPGNIWQIRGRTTSDVYAVGDGGVVYHCNGSTWSRIDTGLPTDHVYDIYVASATAAFFVGRGGIFQWDGSGWTDHGGMGRWLNAVTGTADDDVWVFGVGGVAAHYDGSTWTDVPSATHEALLGAHAAASGDVFAVGFSGTVVWWDGVAFSPMATRTQNELVQISGVSREHLLAVGAGGVILEFTGQLPTVGSMIISEYVEGSANDKAVELYNGSANAVDLSACSLARYANGSASPSNTYTFAAVDLVPGSTYVLCNSAADAGLQAYCDATENGATAFNGDDALVLTCSGTVVDSVGRVGEDPGTAWGSAPESTANQTLRRNASVVTGDTNPTDAYDPAAQWTGYPADTFDGLGSR